MTEIKTEAGSVERLIPAAFHDAIAALSLQDELVKALDAVLTIPAVRSMLGTKHTAGCDCPCCRAHSLLTRIKSERDRA